MEGLLIMAVAQCLCAGEATLDEMKLAREWVAAHVESALPPSSFVYGNSPSAVALGECETARESKSLDEHRTQHRVRCSDPKTGLNVEWEAVEFSDYPAVEWVLRFRNEGAADTPILQDVQALDLAMPSPKGEAVVHYAKGATCSMEDFRPMTRIMNAGARMHLQPGGGRSSSEFLPFFNIEIPGGTGVMMAIGWSGEWAAEFNADKEHALQLRAGMALTHLTLHPGEAIRTPRILLLFYQGDWMRGQNLLRRFLLDHHRPTANGKPIDMPAFNGNWGGTRAADHLANIQAIIDHVLPFEYYWIDAEWFGHGPWYRTAGDWRVKQDLYPDGFRPLSDRLHASGRKLLLWFEPERVCEDTPWYMEHAPWLLDVPKERRAYNWGTSQAEPDWPEWESKRNQIREDDRLFNLGIPEARQFLTDFISARIDEFGLDCYRHDANIAPLEFWRAADAPDRQGITEIRWIEGLYAFWDDLLQRHPGLIIDNCASGGRRIDIETLERSTPFWRTDHPSPAEARQCHTYGLSMWVPLNATGATSPATDSDYAFRSTFSSSLTFGLFGNGDAAQGKSVPPDFPFDKVKSMLQQYRSIQPLYLGDYYPLTEYSQAEDAWMAWQFDRPDVGQGLIQVFRRPKSVCETGHLCLKGLDPEARYRVTNLDATAPVEYSGRELMDQGLPVSIPERPVALLFKYERL